MDKKSIKAICKAMFCVLTFAFSAPLKADEKKLSFEAQALLIALGYDLGAVDGQFGKKSKNALLMHYASKGNSAKPVLDKAILNDLRVDFFGSDQESQISDWNGNFIVPLEILKKLSQTSRQKIERFCGGNTRWQQEIINKSIKSSIPQKLEGFNSRMDNYSSVNHAEELDLFVLSFSRLATSFIALDNHVDAELALDGLYNWANGDAFLDTVECTVSGRLDDKKCTEWTEFTGQDLSSIKDHSTVQMHMMHLSYGYYMGLNCYKENDGRHPVIKKWFEAFYLRNKSPDREPYFGLDHGWYWPAILENQLHGRSSINLVKSIIKQLQREIFEDGSIKNRTTRGNRALWYHHDGMKEIMISLEIARRHGVSIPLSLDAKVKKAGEIFIRGFVDHSYLNRWAKVAHNAIYVEGEQEFKENLNDIPNGNSWFHIYAYRYPNSELTKQLRTLLQFENSNSASKDAMIGFGLGCLYSAASDY
ncbi:peptidoglycan-binding domain-containing protein [Pseudopelagicola sp. nBUS_19]|uniref:peptidoglycan-binding domain-containing protein n=1 Tax=Pseudopelagicola sp. nBUS_19 TaxID=3395316 RepID=UPI003EB6A0F9